MTLQKKKKKCDGCGELTYIWKSSGTGGRKLCKQCSYDTGVAKPSNIKLSAKQKPIPPRSQKRSKEERLYSGKRVIFLQEHPMCNAHIPGICTQHATDVHHKAGRTGSLYLDETHWVALCRACHSYIEAHPKEAREMGFSELRLNK